MKYNRKKESIIVYCATREKKFILRVWSLMLEQSEDKNLTSKINVFPLLHMIFFLLGGQTMDLFISQGVIKCTSWRAIRKKDLF